MLTECIIGGNGSAADQWRDGWLVVQADLHLHLHLTWNLRCPRFSVPSPSLQNATAAFINQDASMLKARKKAGEKQYVKPCYRVRLSLVSKPRPLFTRYRRPSFFDTTSTTKYSLSGNCKDWALVSRLASDRCSLHTSAKK
jgi:hypothetical protein